MRYALRCLLPLAQRAGGNTKRPLASVRGRFGSKLVRMATCNTCEGSGALEYDPDDAWTSPKRFPCTECGGTGESRGGPPKFPRSEHVGRVPKDGDDD